MTGQGTGSEAKRAQLKADYIAAKGFWPQVHDALLELDPDFLRAFLQLGDAASARGALDAKTREFVAIAIDSSATHLYNVGTRNHIRQALRLGATKEEILEVLEMVSLIGIHTTTEAMPLLRDALLELEAERRDAEPDPVPPKAVST